MTGRLGLILIAFLKFPIALLNWFNAKFVDPKYYRDQLNQDKY